MNAYLHHQSATSNKVYSLHLRATTGQRWAVMGWYGKYNSPTLQTHGAFKIFATLAEARAKYDALYAAKNAKYSLVAESVVWPNGPHWLIGRQTVPDADIQAIANGAAPAATSPYPTAPTSRRTRRQSPSATYTAPTPPPYTAPPPPYSAPPPPPSRPAPTAHLPVIPAWLRACFSEIPASSRPQAATILATIFPSEQHFIFAAAARPEPCSVDWMRVAFMRLPLDQRKPLYRQFTKVLHSDYSHDNELYRRWIATYNRFATT